MDPNAHATTTTAKPADPQQPATPATPATPAPTIDGASDIAKGLKDRAAALDSGKQPPAAPATPAAEGSAAELSRLIDAAVAERVKPLQEKLDGYEKNAGKVEEQRRGEDAREAFIRGPARNFPAGLARKLLPATTDQKQLDAAAKDLETELKNYVAHLAAAGAIRYVNIGGANREGGQPVGAFVAPSDATPAAQIAEGLKNRRGNGQRIDGPMAANQS